MLPKSIQDLAEKMRYFPGVGVRSSQKLALDVLQLSPEKYEELIGSLKNVRAEVCFCDNCGFFAQKEAEQKAGVKINQLFTLMQDQNHSLQFVCEICKDTTRNLAQICLVEKATDVITVEKSQFYRGTYHVLQNLISPLDNIFAEDTSIGDLLERKIPKLLVKYPKVELILFFKAGFSSEATTAYLKEVLKQRGLLDKVSLTKLAQGLPLYYNPDTLDQATMAKALEDRREA
jgi:recombination protein RecR